MSDSNSTKETEENYGKKTSFRTAGSMGGLLNCEPEGYKSWEFPTE
jgi:hypothetical protein